MLRTPLVASVRWWAADHAKALMWSAFALATTTAVVSLLAFALARSAEHRARETALADDQVTAPRDVNPHAPNHSTDFVARLAPLLGSDRVAQVVTQSASTAGASVATLRVQPRESVAGQLSRADFQLEMHGPYASVKRALADVIERLHPCTVSRLQWRADAGSSDTQASVIITLWGAPADSSPSAGSR
jgi:hypothetical protein